MKCVYILAVVVLSAIMMESTSALEEFEGIEVSVHDWYPNLFPLDVEKPMTISEDIKCNLISSFVTAALLMKRIEGSITKDQMSQAIRNFEACKKLMCRNTAMIDKFMKPYTFKEQVDLLVAQVKISDIEYDKIMIFHQLVDPKFSRNIYDEFFPVYDSGIIYVQRHMVFDMIENVCEQEVPEEFNGYIQPNDTIAIFLSILVDKYTSDAITDEDIAELLKEQEMSISREIWMRIAERILAPTSNLATSCLDPSLAFYDIERSSVTAIRGLAKALGLSCDRPAPLNIWDFDFVFEPVKTNLPPPSSIGTSGGAPGSTIGGAGGAPTG